MTTRLETLQQIKTLQRSLRIQGFVPIPATARAVISSTLEGKAVMNVVHLAYSPPATQPEMQTLADSLADAWFARVFPLMSPNALFEGVEVQDISGLNGPAAVSSHHVGSPGSDTHPERMLPRSICAVVTLHTGFTGHAGRGRIFISGLSEGWVGGLAAGILHADAVQLFTTAINGVQTDLAAAQTGLVVASRATSPGTSRLVTNSAISSQLGSQRRRLH